MTNIQPRFAPFVYPTAVAGLGGNNPYLSVPPLLVHPGGTNNPSPTPTESPRAQASLPSPNP